MELKITRACLECGGRMDLRYLRPDPHEPPERKLVCPGCGAQEIPPRNIEMLREDRPWLPGF